MAAPRLLALLGRVDAHSRFEGLVRQVEDRTSLAPLLRALGFEPQLVVIPPAARAAFGLADVREVLTTAVAGARGDVVALLAEMTGEATAERVARVARSVRAHNAAKPYLFIVAEPQYARLVFASFGLDGQLRQLAVERRRPRATDLEAFEEMAVSDVGGVALMLCYARALDRSRVTRHFFRDFRAQRAQTAAAWTGMPETLLAEREQLALLFLSRLMFLYFLQRRGHLAGDADYLPGLFQTWRKGEAHADRQSFYRAALQPLFFGALNTRPEARPPEAQALGPLPYLNGGLFERHALERRFPGINLPDEAVASIFDGLLERYRFTTHEAAEAAVERSADAGVDPEMLGRVFEELMATDRRGATGTFYTPAAVVDRLVCSALEAYLAGAPGIPAEQAAALVRGDAEGLSGRRRQVLSEHVAQLRVLDPACGSGAFLLGALSRLSRLRSSLEGRHPATFRREIIGRSLHGVDVQEDAALLCALRLWLALAMGETAAPDAAVTATPATRVPLAAVEVPASEPGAEEAGYGTIEPLPNLDRRIRQGDALVDPLDIAVAGPASGHTDTTAWRSAAADAAVRRALRTLEPWTDEYLTAGPEEKPGLQRRLVDAESTLARAWLDALERRLSTSIEELHEQAEARDLFGELPVDAATAQARCRALEARRAELHRLRTGLADAGALPFFSFRVHFAEASKRGFDLVLSNPPWVRAHRWPAPIRQLVRRSYTVCQRPGWAGGVRLIGAPAGVAAQVDLALLFLERSLRLLAPGGTLGMVLPAKALRSLYGGAARCLLIRQVRIIALEDHALDQRSIFRADAFAATIVATKLTSHPVPGTEPPRQGAVHTQALEPPHMRRPHPAGRGVRIRLVRRGVPPLEFALPQNDLPILPDDAESPWLLAPPDARSALRRIQSVGAPLGAHPDLRVRRGVLTGANDILIVREAEAKLGDLARISADGYFRARRAGRSAGSAARYRALVEASALRPLVRGSGISAWQYRTAGHLIWVHDDEYARPRKPPPRVARYLARHGPVLRARSGWRASLPTGAVFRASRDTLRCKVAWNDLAETLNAVALPACTRSVDGHDRPLLPLNTVYFVPTESEERALLLAAFLNSLPARTFARAVAERAKDARFRFFAWTIASLPLPEAWYAGPAADRLLRISRGAHTRGFVSRPEQAELDALVGRRYGLGTDELGALAAFDAWLRGEARP